MSSSSAPAASGLPTALFLAEQGIKPLVIDQFASAGQGSNKAAIGGIRATHSTPAKIHLCLESLRIFSTWKETYGDNIEWAQGGYTFVAYRDEEERALQGAAEGPAGRRAEYPLAEPRRDDRPRPGAHPRGPARRHVLARGRIGLADALGPRVLPARGRARRASSGSTSA